MKTQLKYSIGLPLVAGLLMLAGCVVTSVYPYFTAKDIVFDSALVGKWTEKQKEHSSDEYWQFSKTNGMAYILTVRDGEDVTEFKAHLFQLKNRRFIDAEPTKREGDFIPPHYLLQVHRFTTNELEMSVINYEWLEELVTRKPSAIAHHWVDRDEAKKEKGTLVLTADTAKLQAFVLKYAADTNAFAEPFKMIRQ